MARSAPGWIDHPKVVLGVLGELGGESLFSEATRMQDQTEKKLGDLTIRIDRLLCVGFGDCIEVAPEVFEFDDEGIVRFRDDAPPIERDRLIRSCDICPVDALEAVDADGTMIVP